MIVVKLLHPENAELLIKEMGLGIVIDVKLIQPWNVELLMEVRD